MEARRATDAAGEGEGFGGYSIASNFHKSSAPIRAKTQQTLAFARLLEHLCLERHAGVCVLFVFNLNRPWPLSSASLGPCVVGRDIECDCFLKTIDVDSFSMNGDRAVPKLFA